MPYKRLAMNWARTILLQKLYMLPCAVPFVLGKTVLRKLSVKIKHHSVSRYLCDNACRGNAVTQRVAVNYGNGRQLCL